MPTLAQLTTAEQRWADREEDNHHGRRRPLRGGSGLRPRWMAAASSPDHGSHLQNVRDVPAASPHRIDGELLRYAPRGFGLPPTRDAQIDEHGRIRDPGRFLGARIDVDGRGATRPPGSERTPASRLPTAL